MKTRIAWIDKIEGKTEQCIYDLCYNPSGTQLIVASGQHVLVYESNDGALIQLLKGHKDVVYCVCYAKDGKKFASGSADKTVIIWTSKLEGLLKYSHNEAVQSMQFNPVSSQLLSCSLSDIAIWTAEQKAVQKFKSGGRINCCAWTKEGQYMVLGLASGYVSIRNKNGEERLRIDRSLDSPIWSLACSPAKEDTVDVICIGEWGGILSFYTINGKLIGKEKSLNFIPLKILYFPKGEYILISGSNKQCLLLSRDGIQLGQIGSTFSSWAWSCMIHPESSRVTIGCQDGTITNFELSWNIVHGLYVDRYAYRENMTDIVILHLITNQKVRIKCKDLIQNIAVYRDRLAVQLPERVLIYEPSGNIEDIHYQIRYRLSQSLECNLLVVTTNNLIVNLDKRLRSLSFKGVVEREWLLDDPISYIKIVGGPTAKEHLLAGLTNGHILQFYLDNPFPSPLVKVDGAVHCVDISSTKEKLAIVTNQRVLFVFDIFNDKKVQEFQHVTSAAFHTAFEEMMSFSGQDRLAIKLSNFSEYKQKCSGIIFGLHGSKMFCLHGSVIISMEIPLSSLMYQYLESKIFDKAYIIACLGVADSDWLILGITALNYLEFNIAYKAFTRIKKLHHAEILSDIEEKLKSGKWGREACLATAAASMGKLRDAAKLYQKAGLHQEVLDMYSDLRMFDIAQEFISNGSNLDRVALLRKRAEWANSLGEPRAAAEIFFSAGDVQRAIKIISEYGWTDMLIKVGRELDKADRENLIFIAKKLQQLGAMLGAAEIFDRLGNDSDVADVLVDAQAWHEAFELVERNSKLRSRVYGSYARWLVEIGRFSEAENAFRIAGQSKASIPILNILLKNAVSEKRFQDASYFYWLLSQLSLDLDKNTEEIKLHFMTYYDKADIYYAYHKIYTYLEEPFTALMPEDLFNISKFLLIKIQAIEVDDVSRLAIMYTLLRQACSLGANKLAKQLLDHLHRMKIPKHLLTQIESWMISLKSYPYSDPEELLPLCNRCSTYNPILSVNITSSNNCTQCGLKFQYSFVMFEILPLVEFDLESDITDEEAQKLMEEPVRINNETFSTNKFTRINQSDLFMYRLLQYEDKYETTTVTVSRKILKSMEPTSVLVVKWPKPFTTRFYRNLMPDLQVTYCKSCLKLYQADDYELAILCNKYCPFCRTPSSMEIQKS